MQDLCKIIAVLVTLPAIFLKIFLLIYFRHMLEKNILHEQLKATSPKNKDDDMERGFFLEDSENVDQNPEGLTLKNKIHALLHSSVEKDQEEGLTLMSEWLQKIQVTYQSVLNQKKRKEMIRQITRSEDFAEGNLMVHQVQIQYIKDLIDVVDNDSLKQKLQKQLTLIEYSFAALQYIREFNIHTQARYSWRNPARWIEKIVWTSASGIGTTGLGVTIGAVMQMVNTGNFYEAAGVLFGAGVAAQMVFGEINKFDATLRFNKKIKEMLDLSKIAPDEIEGDLEDWQKEYESKIQILLSRVSTLRSYNDFENAPREL